MLSEIVKNNIVNFRIKIKSDGIIKTYKKIMQYVYDRIIGKILKIEKFIVTEKILDKKNEIIEPKIDVTYETINDENLQLLNGKILEKKINLFKQRIFNGNIGILVFANNEVASFSWALKREEKNKIGLKIPITDNEIVLKDGFVFPDFRRKGLQTYMKSILINKAYKNDVKKIYAAFYEWNIFSRKAYMRNNFNETTKVYLIKIFGLNYQYSRNIRRSENITTIENHKE